MIDNGCSVVACTDTCGDDEVCSDSNMCETAACVPTSDEEVTWEACSDGLDNDCNELTDSAEETGCAVCPPPGDAASAAAEDSDALCADGIDNDCDGFLDCADFDCDGSTACPAEDTDALCGDGIDNDGDGRIDCLGRSCTEATAVTVCDAATTGTEDDTTVCADLLDNDGNDRVDCDDDACEGIGYCAGAGDNEDDVTDGCTDGFDNDGDGRIDCADSNCSDDAACTGENDAATCVDGLDNDGDGRIDCADSDCYTDPSFTVCLDTPEDCSAAGDEDFDGLENCFDPECLSACEAMACSVDNPVGTCAGAGEVCSVLGTCVTPPSAAGDIVISEIMKNPSATDDNDGEYFEIHNPSTTATYNLVGCTITSGTNGPYPIDASLEIGPGEYKSLARTTSAGFTPDYVYDSRFNLGNGSDDAQVSCGGTLIDIVAYDGGTDFPDPNGASMNLSPAALDATSNDTGSNWCESTSDLGNTDLGTPGAANDTCT